MYSPPESANRENDWRTAHSIMRAEIIAIDQYFPNETKIDVKSIKFFALGGWPGIAMRNTRIIRTPKPKVPESQVCELLHRVERLRQYSFQLPVDPRYEAPSSMSMYGGYVHSIYIPRKEGNFSFSAEEDSNDPHVLFNKQLKYGSKAWIIGSLNDSEDVLISFGFSELDPEIFLSLEFGAIGREREFLSRSQPINLAYTFKTTPDDITESEYRVINGLISMFEEEISG